MRESSRDKDRYGDKLPIAGGGGRAGGLEGKDTRKEGRERTLTDLNRPWKELQFS